MNCPRCRKKIKYSRKLSNPRSGLNSFHCPEPCNTTLITLGSPTVLLALSSQAVRSFTYDSPEQAERASRPKARDMRALDWHASQIRKARTPS